MHELGFPRDYYGPSAPWAEEVKAEAAGIFHLVGARSGGEWAGALAGGRAAGERNGGRFQGRVCDEAL